MRVLVSGATGFVGRALVPHLEREGWTVHRLVRGAPAPSEAGWGEDGGPIDASALPGGTLDGLDAVVHLAGASIASRRWTEARRRELVESRVRTTAKLAAALAACSHPPVVLASASAVGWYGDRGEEEVDEGSGRGTGFLSDLCRRWEEEAVRAADAGTRAVMLRSGIVLGAGGGTLEALLHLFRFGLGGPVASGRQWVSWISLEDELRAITHLLGAPDVSGPVNLVSPAPVRNAELTAALGTALHRPTVARAPAAGMRLILGRQMADELLLVSQRVRPARLLESGFVFRHPEIGGALAAALAERG